MTDFFAQLAARYRGEAGTLRPRVPFRFEPVSPALAAAALTAPGPGAQRGSRRSRLLPGDVLPGDPLPEEPVASDPVATDPHEPAPAGHPARSRTGSRGDTRPGSEPVLPDRPPAARLAPSARRPARQARHDPAATEHALSPAGPAGRAAPGRTLPPGPDTLLADTAAPRSETATAGRGTAAPGPEPAALRPRPGRAARAAALEPRAADGAVPRTADNPGELAAGPGREARRQQPGHAPAILAPEAGRRQARGYAAEPSGPAQESITVQVTIGRVEVRAAAPAASARAPAVPAAGPSLADYLRDRSRSAGAAP